MAMTPYFGSPNGVPMYDLCLGVKNVNGTFAFLSSPFVFDNEQIDEIVLIKYVPDFNDVRLESANPISMSLLPDGSVVLVEEPALPFFLKKNAEKLYQDCEAGMAYACRTSHNITVAALADNTNDKQMKKHILRFPEGMTGKMGYMNDIQGLELTGHIHISGYVLPKANEDKMTFTQVTMRFMIPLNSEAPKLLKSKQKYKSNVNDLLEDSLISIDLLSLEPGPVSPKKLTTVTPKNSTTVPLKNTTELSKFGAGNNTTSTPSSEMRPLLEQDSPWSYSSTIVFEDMAIESASKKRSNSSVQDIENDEEDDEEDDVVAKKARKLF